MALHSHSSATELQSSGWTTRECILAQLLAHGVTVPDLDPSTRFVAIARLTADYRPLAGVAFPYRVEMRAEPGDRLIRVRYTSPSLNDVIDDGLFVLAPLPGVKELAIEEYPLGGAS